MLHLVKTLNQYNFEGLLCDVTLENAQLCLSNIITVCRSGKDKISIETSDKVVRNNLAFSINNERFMTVVSMGAKGLTDCVMKPKKATSCDTYIEILNNSNVKIVTCYANETAKVKVLNQKAINAKEDEKIKLDLELKKKEEKKVLNYLFESYTSTLSKYTYLVGHFNICANIVNKKLIYTDTEWEEIVELFENFKSKLGTNTSLYNDFFKDNLTLTKYKEIYDNYRVIAVKDLTKVSILKINQIKLEIKNLYDTSQLCNCVNLVKEFNTLYDSEDDKLLQIEFKADEFKSVVVKFEETQKNMRKLIAVAEIEERSNYYSNNTSRRMYENKSEESDFSYKGTPKDEEVHDGNYWSGF